MKQNTTAMVSILIPVYNRESLIGDCINSALAQIYPDFEVIVVDNASTDNTWAVCQAFAAKDPRVRVFRNSSNLGPVRNWQRCLEEARGVYGKILFSDDLIAPEFLAQTVPFLRDKNVGFVFTGIDIGERPGMSGQPYWWRLSSGTWPSRTFIRESLLGGKLPVSPGAALFRLADLMKNLRLEIPTAAGIDFCRYGAGPDVLLYLLTAADYTRVAYLALPLTFFRSHPESITVRENSGMIASHYYQAKLWFAGTVSSFDLKCCFGSLRQQCLAFGWQMQRRENTAESLADFCRRMGARPVGWCTLLCVWLYRFQMRCQRSARRLLARWLGGW